VRAIKRTFIRSDNVQKLDFKNTAIIAFSCDINEKRTAVFNSYFTVFLRNLNTKKLYSFVVNPEFDDKLYFYIGVPLIGPVELGEPTVEKHQISNLNFILYSLLSGEYELNSITSDGRFRGGKFHDYLQMEKKKIVLNANEIT